MSRRAVQNGVAFASRRKARRRSRIAFFSRARSHPAANHAAGRDDRLLFDDKTVSASSGKVVHRLVVRRIPPGDPAR